MPDYNFHVLAYFDLLGQGELLESLTDQFVIDCIVNGKRENLMKVMKPTFGRVRQFREHIRKIVEDANKPIPIPSTLKGKIKENVWTKLTATKIDVEFMGDAALLKVCITNNPGETIPIVSIKDLFMCISMQTLFILGAGIPIRGAIELGWGTHIDDSIYGTMLHRAFRLEKEAEYPRIVIGQNLLNYIRPLSEIPQRGVTEDEAKIIKSKAEKALAMIIEDDDGESVLNYLQRDLFSANEAVFKECVRCAKKFIQFEIENRQRKRDTKLLNKYCRLRNFFKKQGVWSP